MSSRNPVGLFLLLLCSFFAMTAQAESADEQSVDDPVLLHQPNGLIVTTGLVGLPEKHMARLALIQARPDSRLIPVVLRFKDAEGNVLARRRGELGPRQSVIEVLNHADLRIPETVLVQTEIILGPVHPIGRRECPLHLTLQVVPEDDGNGPGYSCSGIDPCLGTLQGPSGSGGVFPICDTRPTFVQR